MKLSSLRKDNNARVYIQTKMESGDAAGLPASGRKADTMEVRDMVASKYPIFVLFKGRKVIRGERFNESN